MTTIYYRTSDNQPVKQHGVCLFYPYEFEDPVTDEVELVMAHNDVDVSDMFDEYIEITEDEFIQLVLEYFGEVPRYMS